MCNFGKPLPLNNHYRTIVISDLHLGIHHSRVREVVRFLKNHTCEKLILNGDIIDGWQLRKSGKWRKRHTSFFKLLMKYLSGTDMKVVYLRGNHDDFLDEVLPLTLGNFSIERTHLHESFGRRYFVVHGDIFDTVTTRLKWIAKLGDTGYTFLLWLNGHYNEYRRRRGLPYFSLSQQVKRKVKTAVSFISDFEQALCEVAKAEDCDGVICGHIHQAADKRIDGIHYLNSGDWVESLTAVVENTDGRWELVNYVDWHAAFAESEVPKAEEDSDPLREGAWGIPLPEQMIRQALA